MTNSNNLDLKLVFTLELGSVMDIEEVSVEEYRYVVYLEDGTKRVVNKAQVERECSQVLITAATRVSNTNIFIQYVDYKGTEGSVTLNLGRINIFHPGMRVASELLV